MDRKKFGAVLDEAVGQLEGEVRVMKNQKQTLTLNIKNLEIQKNKLSKEILAMEDNLKKLKEDYDKKVKDMEEFVLDKKSAASKKEAAATRKLAELDQKTEEVKNSIKSNEGLQKSLVTRNDSSKIKEEKLLSIIKATIESIKTI